jgi:hypothetical protein
VEGAKPKPESSLIQAVRLSTIYRAMAAIERRAGLAGDAAAIEKRDRDLWQSWQSKLPGDAFVRRRLTAGSSGG